MQKKTTDILIIGAGLTGLTLAYYLKQLDISVTLVEARQRIGGRIYTKQNANEAPIELGATWLVNEHTKLLKLINTLHLDVFEQFYGKTAIYEPNATNAAQLVNLPQSNQASYRVKDGTESIINTLAKELQGSQIITNCKISSIENANDFITAKSKTHEFECKQMVSTLPPFLFEKTITTKPKLNEDLKIVMQNTHTWMHDSIKVGFTFKEAFWKGNRTSGTIYSNVSALQEFYDHSNTDGTLHALVGFMNKELHSQSKHKRQELALKQLELYYGNQVYDFLSYEELIWQDEPYTTASYDSFLMPQQNNGHPLFQKPTLNNRLYIAGTETSTYASGKMEGAVRSALQVFNQIKSLL